jgi:hypothetical protein
MFQSKQVYLELRNIYVVSNINVLLDSFDICDPRNSPEALNIANFAQQLCKVEITKLSSDEVIKEDDSYVDGYHIRKIGKRGGN